MEQEKKEYVTDEQLREYFPDLPTGPLDSYRKRATFDWRRMKLVYETLGTIKLKNEIWSFMRKHPLFQHTEATRTLDEERHITVKRMYAIFNENFLPYEKIGSEPRLLQAETEAMFMFDSSLAVKMSLTFRMFSNTIQGNGQDHHYHYLDDVQEGKIGGCFALTEVAHGSNAKGMRTTATYLPEKRQFVLHSADFEAAKFWVGCLGVLLKASAQDTMDVFFPVNLRNRLFIEPTFFAVTSMIFERKCATHALIYAMLVSKGKNHGLHTFVVPIRDPKTLLPYPGVIVGDIGEKVGLNGVDNGFVMFNNYHLPKEVALDKLGGVDDNGDYQTPFRDPSKRFGAALGILSGGRVHITSISANYLQKAIVIAVRYSAVRKQFGPENSTEEYPVLEYQQQQIRLLPYLAATYALRIFSNWFGYVHIILSINRMLGIDDNAAARGIEMHALSSAVKPVCGWTARDGIQNCREACGGHGYLKASAIGDIRNDNDANCTYEGENSLLLQQASNWLLNVWPRRNQLTADDTPYGSLDLLTNIDQFLKETCPSLRVEQFTEPANLIKAYKWLTGYMLKMTHEKVAKLKSEGKDNFAAKNDSQSFNAVTLSVVYGENFILNHFHKTVLAYEDAACKKVLLKLVSLYGAFMLEKHMATLYIGGYFTRNQGLLLREAILKLCADIAPESVALADALAPPDWCLKSVLGMSDGEAYKHIQNSVMTYPGAMTRPEWWRDVVHWRSYVQSKL